MSTTEPFVANSYVIVCEETWNGGLFLEELLKKFSQFWLNCRTNFKAKGPRFFSQNETGLLGLFLSRPLSQLSLGSLWPVVM